jgi:hypothetical protein
VEDLNEDGEINKEDLELMILRNKSRAQRHMAWISISSMLLATVFLFSPAISDSRIEALSDILGLFYLSLSGIVGAFMGFTTWMAKK